MWDGNNIKEFDIKDFRWRISVIFQDFVRFDLTVFENIALGNIWAMKTENSQAGMELVQKAAKKAGIHETIQALPNGYNTILSRWLVGDGEKGVDLSGG